ncbi:hypothetical protein SAMN03159382_00046 [Pseudomonas sp. NFACC23-1]|nr:hypothetical protein SAMN03159386_04684 [Pseudomonas sp. NFACC17-2]SEI79071.1 hypothetical protein SAMN03159382_00046 [Pseudomonas sp. NFACC23-1]SFW91089.1 hypothetical protein SAMN05660640_05110 [Pseudomonas sp. NFACC16-2]
MEIQPITHMPPQISALEKEAVAEGFRFITRLTSEWHSGINRFDAPGECLMAAYLDRQLVASEACLLIRSRIPAQEDCGVFM